MSLNVPRSPRRNCPQMSRAALLVWAVMLVLSLAPSAAAQLDAVWRAQPEDRFVINTLSRRENRISVGNQPAEFQTVIDQLQLEYSVAHVLPSGAARFQIEILTAARSVPLPDRVSSDLAATTPPASDQPSEVAVSKTAGDQDPPHSIAPSVVSDARRISELEGTVLRIDVAPDGMLESVSFDDRDRLIGNLARLNQATGLFLKECCSDETLAAWLTRPFWLAVPPGQMAAGQSWDRADEISLGILGSARLTVRIQAPDTLPEKFPAFLPLRLNASGRFVPRLNSLETQQTLPWHVTDLQVDVSDGTGTASFYDPGSSPPPENQRRPPFVQLHLAFRIHGSCQVETHGDSHPVTFEQRQSQNWFLVSWPSNSPSFRLSPQVRLRLRGVPKIPR